MTTILSVYGSHNASMALYHNDKITVAEVERWVNIKNAGMSSYLPSFNHDVVYEELCDYLIRENNIDTIDLHVHSHTYKFPNCNVKKHITVNHHVAHAAGAFYQSPYKEALAFTFDGGGDGAYFNVYKCDRENSVTLLSEFNQDLGFAYMILGDHLQDIRKESITIGNLVYAGKIMGLCSYGNIREEWIEPFTEFYQKFKYSGEAYIGGMQVKKHAVPKLFKDIGVENFNVDTTRFEGQFAWDIAATTQYVFEQEFLRLAKPFIDKHSDLPICMSGGCALNVLLNTKLLEMLDGKVFVPPNTNDCGIAVGGLLHHLKPEEPVDLTYVGLPILDRNLLSSYVEDYRYRSTRISIKDLAQILQEGNIIGIINGNSEHGSRALGNRSIMCNPIDGMKDTLNAKVKHREWYRPFAPVVRYEDTSKYFDFPEGVESRHMTFVANVKEEYKTVIPSITHTDGTARLQTVRKEQNSFLYELLTEFDKINEHGVLLNTSFNDNGKPILSTLKDAFNLLKMSSMDGVYYDGKVYYKESNEDKFKKYFTTPYTDGTSVFNFIIDPKNQNLLNELDDNSIVVMNQNITIPRSKKFIIEKVTDHNKYYTKELKLNGKSLEDFSPYLRLLWLRDMIRDYKINKKIKKVVTINLLDDGKSYKFDTDKMLNILNTYEQSFISCMYNDCEINPDKLIEEAIKLYEK